MSTYRRTNSLSRLWRLGTAFFSFWLLPSRVALLSLSISVGGVAVSADVKRPNAGSCVGSIEIAHCCMVDLFHCFISDAGENSDNGAALNHILVDSKPVTLGKWIGLRIDNIVVTRAEAAGWIGGGAAVNMLNGHTFIFVPSNVVVMRKAIPFAPWLFLNKKSNVGGGRFMTDVGISDIGLNGLSRLQWIDADVGCGDACPLGKYQCFMGRFGALPLRDGLRFRGGSEISVRSDQSVGLIRANFHFAQLPIDDVDGTIGYDSAGYADQEKPSSKDGDSDGRVRYASVELIWLFVIGWFLAAAGLLRAIFWLVYDFGNARHVVAALALAVASVGVAVYTTDGIVGALDHLP